MPGYRSTLPDDDRGVLLLAPYLWLSPLNEPDPLELMHVGAPVHGQACAVPIRRAGW